MSCGGSSSTEAHDSRACIDSCPSETNASGTSNAFNQTHWAKANRTSAGTRVGSFEFGACELWIVGSQFARACQSCSDDPTLLFTVMKLFSTQSQPNPHKAIHTQTKAEIELLCLALLCPSGYDTAARELANMSPPLLGTQCQATKVDEGMSVA